MSNPYGAPRKFNNETLLAAFEDYLDAHEKRGPIIEVKPHAFNGEIVYSSSPKARSITFQAFANHIRMTRTNFEKWRGSEDLGEAMEYIDNYIFSFNFELAAANQLSPVLVSRYLGISEKVENDHKSTDGSMTPTRIERVIIDVDTDKNA